jgi:FAD/FMN-containing dehydrogenase
LGLPEPLHGETIFLLLPCYAGSIEAGKEALEPLRAFGDPIADTVQPMPYTALQQMLDDRWGAGHRNYWKSRDYRELTDDAIDTMVEYCDSTAPFFSVFIEWMEGAVGRADPGATAFPHRDIAFDISVLQLWSDPERDDEYIGWARKFHEAMAPYAADGVYVNYLDRDEAERVPEAYGERYERLRELKAVWDPENLFRMNQNIKPSD